LLLVLRVLVLVERLVRCRTARCRGSRRR